MSKYLKVAKTENAEVPCQFLFFKYWNRNNKHRIYITDYKGRTLGFINLDKDDRVEIEDSQGNTKDEIEMALGLFMDCYLDKFKQKYNID